MHNTNSDSKDKKFFKSLTLPIHIYLTLIILLSLFLTAVMFFLQTNGLYDLKEVFEKTNYLPVLLNFLPIFLLALLLFFLLNNFVLSAGIIALLVIAASYVNRYKIILRQDPLLPWDFSLLNEVVAILNGVDMRLFLGIFVGLVLIIFFTILLNLFFKTPKINLPIRIGVAVLLIILLSVLNKNVYANVNLFDSLYVKGNVYNQVESFNSKGFVYSFLYASNINKLKKFDGYNKEIVETMKNKYSENLSGNDKKINVFIVMSEAFSDISDNDALDFSGTFDPLENFKKIRENSLNGHIVVPGLGGGTADTEFDVLTAINTRNFRGAPFAYRIVNKPLESIASILNSLGFGNTAIHPGHAWFYNRQNVYKFFGFSKFIDITNYPDDDMYKGMYVKENLAMDTIIEEFENHKKTNPEIPFLDFCVTIQNHGPYKDKYLVDTNFKTDLPLTEDDINSMSNYFEGLRDADEALGKLYDYVQSSDEPIAVLFFGDHLPAFSKTVYENLVDSEESDLTRLTNRYITPYLIFQNKSAEEIGKLENATKFERFSSNYLGAYFMNLIGYKNLDPYFDCTMEMMNKYPIVLEKQYFDSNYNLSDSADNTELKNYSYWQYYRIFEKLEEKK